MANDCFHHESGFHGPDVKVRVVAILATRHYEGHPCSDPGQPVVKKLVPHATNYA